MKEKITALILALMIALGLSACDGTKTGTTTNDNDVMGDEHSNVQQQVPDNNNTNSDTNNNTGSDVGNEAKNQTGTYAGGTYRNGSGSTYGNSSGSTYGNGSRSTYGNNGGMSGYSTTNPANGYRQGVSWQKMLQNGRVHDSDGYLLDGENAHWE